MYFQSASNSSAMAEANEVLIPWPISDREAIKITLPSFRICTNKLGAKVPFIFGIKSFLPEERLHPNKIPPEAKPNNFTKSLRFICCMLLI